jgi:hypothetical protein
MDFSVADPPYEYPVSGGVSTVAREEQSLYHISPAIFKGNFLINLNVYRNFHPKLFVLAHNVILPEQMMFIIALNAEAVWGEPLTPSVIVSCSVFRIKSNRDLECNHSNTYEFFRHIATKCRNIPSLATG